MIRILVADDSWSANHPLATILETSKDVQVLGIAKDGKSTLELIKQFGPDILLLDLEIKNGDYLSTIKNIMNEWPLPIIVLGTISEASSKKTLEALKLGAVDIIVKRDSMHHSAQEILNKIKAAALARLYRFRSSSSKLKHHKFASTRRKFIVIGASTGGPQTIETMLTGLPKNIPSPILIVQHMPSSFTKMFADRLNGICEIEVREAVDGETIKDGVALIAPGGYHLEVKEGAVDGEFVTSLNQEPSELGVRPNVNRLFKSAARAFRENTIGIILTGMGNDGTDGCEKIKEMNGTILAEAEESCIIYGMPKSVIDAGLADEIVQIENMTVAVLQLLDV